MENAKNADAMFTRFVDTPLSERGSSSSGSETSVHSEFLRLKELMNILDVAHMEAAAASDALRRSQTCKLAADKKFRQDVAVLSRA